MSDRRDLNSSDQRTRIDGIAVVVVIVVPVEFELSEIVVVIHQQKNGSVLRSFNKAQAVTPAMYPKGYSAGSISSERTQKIQ